MGGKDTESVRRGREREGEVSKKKRGGEKDRRRDRARGKMKQSMRGMRQRIRGDIMHCNNYYI